MSNRELGYISPYYATKYRSMQTEAAATLKRYRDSTMQMEMGVLFEENRPAQKKKSPQQPKRNSYTPPDNWQSYAKAGSPPTRAEEERRRQQKASQDAATSHEAESETHH